jgi:2-aminomuconate deaminase
MADIYCDNAPQAVGAYPHAKRVGNWIYLSGVGPRLAGSNEVPGNKTDSEGRLVEYDISAQCHSVIKNIQSILSEAGASLKNLVDVTVFLTDMKRDFSTFNEIYAGYFREAGPCRTTVEVNALPTEIAIELKCIAYLGEEIRP